ncbi:hypothetical protein [Photobacterium sanguinicancri]|uniref:hypothetical protein n=1 Tax=Photobacterium sanguinicancri TaxID=875932 RepID=UPI003D0F8922
MTEAIEEVQETSKQATPDRTTDFPTLMQQLDAGVIANVLGLALSNVALAVANSNKKGTITLKLDIKPNSTTDNSIVDVISSIKVTEPKVNHGSKVEDFQYGSVAFVGYGGKLSYDRPKLDVNHQRQLEIPAGINQLKVGTY